jgi:hypothetical protein
MLAALIGASFTAEIAVASPTDAEVAACTPDAKLYCKPQLNELPGRSARLFVFGQPPQGIVAEVRRRVWSTLI